MFLIHVQNDLCLHYPVDVWPYAHFVLACECNEVIVKHTDGVFVFGRTIFLHLCG